MEARTPGPILHRLSQLRNSEFAQHLTLYGGSASVAQAVMMVYALLVARFLGPESYGVFVGCYAATGLSSFLINWGMDTWVLREAARDHSPLALGSAILRVKLATGVIWGALLLLALPAIKPDIFLPQLLLIAIVDVWSDSSFNTLLATMNVQKRLAPASRLMLFSRIGRMFGALAVILLGTPTPLSFAITRCLFTVAALVGAIILLRPFPFRRPVIPEKQILKRSLNFGLSEFLALVYAQADITMLSLLAGKTATGIYSAAAGLINALFVLPNAGYFVSIPVLSRLVESDYARFVSMTRRLLVLFSLAGLVLALGVGLPGQWIILNVLGEKYSQTSALLALLSPILALKSLEFCLASILVAVNWQQQRLIPQAITAAANILLNIWVIPLYGVHGVAVVYLVSEVILALGYSWLVVCWFREKRRGAVLG